MFGDLQRAHRWALGVRGPLLLGLADEPIGRAFRRLPPAPLALPVLTILRVEVVGAGLPVGILLPACTPTAQKAPTSAAAAKGSAAAARARAASALVLRPCAPPCPAARSSRWCTQGSAQRAFERTSEKGLSQMVWDECGRHARCGGCEWLTRAMQPAWCARAFWLSVLSGCRAPCVCQRATAGTAVVSFSWSKTCCDRSFRSVEQKCCNAAILGEAYPATQRSRKRGHCALPMLC